MSRKTRGIARGYIVKNGYRAAPILVALAVLFLSVLGMRNVVHAQALGTLEWIFRLYRASDEGRAVRREEDPTI